MDPKPGDEHHLIESEIDSQPVYEGRVVNLYLQTVQLPNGRVTQREIILHSGASAIVPLRDDGQVILIRQYRKPLNDVIWEIPAGTLEPNEDPIIAASRELREEIGHEPVELIQLGGIHVAPGYSSEFIHVYLARGVRPADLDGDADEFIDVHVLPLTEAVDMVYQGGITDSKTICGLLWATRWLKDNEQAGA